MADPIDPEFHAKMNALAHGLDKIFNDHVEPGQPPEVGFVLMSFKFGEVDNGRVNYISNGRREDMIAAMTEWLARAKGQPLQTGSA